MADTLRINSLVAECRIGVSEWEQANPQKVWLDLELEIDAAKAAAHDDVKDAIDYGELVTSVKSLVQDRSYRLLETMAEDVASLVLKQFRTPSVLVRAKKRALPGIESAEVEVVRVKKQLESRGHKVQRSQGQSVRSIGHKVPT